ncbi:MAG: hypothetical protein HRU36_02650 [Rickettsiales bacterium]|nr:hypothetical protein [Rickettsiales bacterium]
MLWSNLVQTQRLVSKEASAIASAIHIRNDYSEAKNNENITNAFKCYILFIPNNISTKLRNQNYVLELQHAYKLLKAVHSLYPKTKQEQKLYPQLKPSILKAIDTKRKRLSLKNQLSIPI